jgi:hypothetical protein
MQDAELRERHDLIASDKVVGTEVSSRYGRHIGAIERLVPEKRGEAKLCELRGTRQDMYESMTAHIDRNGARVV